ncbi:MAG: DM13 domain-containing protein [Candidatus Peribacteraceae bacterium]
MKHLPFIILTGVILTSCGGNTTSIANENQNPLTAARYGDERADALANLIITADPIVEKDGMREKIQKEIEQAKNIGSAARTELSVGSMGALIPITDDASGFVALIDTTLYFSSDFFVSPGMDMRVYLTTIVDPRDVPFPDESAINVGVLQSVYGAHSYGLSDDVTEKDLRTVVLYDQGLGRIASFAQLSKR